MDCGDGRLVVCAMYRELAILEKLGHIRTSREFDEHYPGLVVTGCGPVNAMEALRDVPRDTPILNIGYAGYREGEIPDKEKVGIGDLVDVYETFSYAPKADVVSRRYALCQLSQSNDFPRNVRNCLTSPDFMTDGELPGLYDMELAFICAMGFTDVASVKEVSDYLSLSEYEKHAKEGVR